MDLMFSSCVLNWPPWPRYHGKSQGLAKAKAGLSLFWLFWWALKRVRKERGKREEGDRRKDGEEGRKERIGNRGGCKLITKFEIIQI